MGGFFKMSVDYGTSLLIPRTFFPVHAGDILRLKNKTISAVGRPSKNFVAVTDGKDVVRIYFQDGFVAVYNITVPRLMCGGKSLVDDIRNFTRGKFYKRKDSICPCTKKPCGLYDVSSSGRQWCDDCEDPRTYERCPIPKKAKETIILAEIDAVLRK